MSLNLKSNFILPIAIFFCLLLSASSMSFDITVDPTFPTTNFLQWNTLQQAITNIMSGYFLFGDDFRIILNPSCVGTTQYVGSTGMAVYGTNALTIQYQSPNPPVSQVSDCSLLPTLVIGEGSQVMFEDLSSLTLSGLNIQYNGDPNQPSYIYYVNQVVFSNVCFNSSEPSHSLPSSYAGNTFYVYQPSTITITNFIMLNDGHKAFYLENMQQLTITNITIVQLPWAVQSFISPIGITNHVSAQQSLSSQITISSFTVICDPTSTLLPNLFLLNSFGSASISDVSFSGCNFISSPLVQPTFFTIWCGIALTIDGMNIRNLQYSVEYAIETIFDIENVNSIQLSNFQVSNVTSNDTLASFLKISDVATCYFLPTYSISMALKNWNVTDLQLSTNSDFIKVELGSYGNFLGATFDTFNLNGGLLASSIFFRLTLPSPTWNTLTENLLSITFQNINLTQNTLQNTASLIYLMESSVGYLQSVETIHLKIANVVIANNNFLNQSSCMTIGGIATSLTDLSADSNIFVNSEFFINRGLIDSFFLSNSTLKNLTFSQQSALIGADLGSFAQFSYAEPSYANQNNGIFAHTRPVLIYNCSFQGIQVFSGSLLLNIVNPIIIYQQNYAFNMTLSGSNFMNLGNYPYYLNTVSYYYNNSQIIPVTNYTIYPFTAAENYLFQDNPTLYSIYNSSRISTYSANQESMIFFIVIQNNGFDFLEASNQTNILVIANFQVPNSSIIISNNIFTNISSSEPVNLIDASYLTLCIFVNQVASQINSSGYLVSYVTSTIEYLLLQNNTMTDSQKFAFYNIAADECSQIILQSNEATNLQTQSTFINIACTLMDGQIYFQNSNFEGIIVTSVPEIIETLSFISYIIEKSSGNGIFYGFENNSFSNITLLNQQGYSKGKYQNSFLLVASLASSIEFTNNTFDLITVASRGSIFEIYVPSINLSNSTFTRFSHSSARGAVNAVFSTLTIIRCLFEKINGSDSIGVFKFSNPDPNNVLLSVNIQSSVFSNNIAPSTTLISLTNSSLNLRFIETQFLSNQVLTDGGSLFSLSYLQTSNISAINCNFTQNDIDVASTKPQISAFNLAHSQGNVQLSIQNSALIVTGQANGAFILIEGGQYNDEVLVSALNYSAMSFESNSGGSTNAAELLVPQFSLFQGENIRATFQSLLVSHLQLNQNGLVIINCDPSSQNSYGCSIQILNSLFKDLILNQPIITINSQSSSFSNALDDLTILIENSIFTNITWLSNSSSNATEGSGEGIISSTSPLVGRTPGGIDFAINIRDCIISELLGTNGLVYNGLETMFDLVLLLHNNSFNSISATGSGGVIQASMSELTAFQSTLSPNDSRNISYLLTFNNFSNISLQAGGGTILYWTSQSRGISIDSENNTFSEINSNQGGIFYLKYTPTTSTILDQTSLSISPEYLVIINSTHDFYNQITAQKGAIIYTEGMNSLMNFNFEKNIFLSIESKSNGGVIAIDPGVYAISTAFSYSSISRMLLITTGTETAQIGAVMLFGNNFTNISVQNGGILFENTPTGTLVVTATNNSFSDVTANSRGGVFFLNQQNVSIEGNTLNMVCAYLTESFIYSVAGHINTSMININNTFLNVSPACNLYSFGPTGLRIQFIQLTNTPNSIYQYEQSSSSTSYPVISNLTSYSLTEYQINFTLIYQDNSDYTSNQYEPVLDESQSKILNLTFTSQDGSNIQNYVSTNCSDSTCAASPTSIILKGNAGDLIFVNATYQSDIYTQSQQFYIQLRACVPGEINITESDQCLYCKAGTYSLVTNDSNCQDCPTGATCNGGASIVMNPGYYRSTANNSVLIVVPCNDSGTQCLGGFDQTNCSDTYSGVVCSQCNFQNGYLSSGKSGTCSQCYDKAKLISFTILLLIASILYQVMMVVVTYNENKNIHVQYLIEKEQKNAEQSSSRSDIPASGVIQFEEEERQQEIRKKKKQRELKPGTFMVMFTTFSQISSIISNFDVGTASTLISISVSVGNSNTQAVFSLQCLYMIVTPDLFEGLQFETLVFVFSPAVKLILFAIFELLRSLISMIKHNQSNRNQNKEEQEEELRRNARKKRTGAAPSTISPKQRSLIRIGAVAVVLFLLEQPGIIASLCQYLTCTKIDPYASQYYIKSRNNIECYTDQYNSFLRTVIIPALIFWAFVIPLVIFLVLHCKGKRLFESEALRLVLGNYYNAYSKDAYYWGIIIILFKMSIFVLDSTITSSDFLKGIVFVLVIHLYFMLFKNKPAYNHDYLNRAEKYCSLAYLIVLSMVFIRMSTESEVANKFCDAMILVCMVGAGGYVLVNVFWLYILKILGVINNLKEKRRILKFLRIYHNEEQNSKTRHDLRSSDHDTKELRFKRRNAFSVDIAAR